MCLIVNILLWGEKECIVFNTIQFFTVNMMSKFIEYNFLVTNIIIDVYKMSVEYFIFI